MGKQLNRSDSRTLSFQRNASRDPKMHRSDRVLLWIRALRPIVMALILSIATYASHAELVRLAQGLQVTVVTPYGQIFLKKEERPS